MDDDIVTALQDQVNASPKGRWPLLSEAADTIKRLRAALAQIDAVCMDYKSAPTEFIRGIIKRVNEQTTEPPGHTDLMVTPESLDEYLKKNPLPE